jgi:hypothetical protein
VATSIIFKQLPEVNNRTLIRPIWSQSYDFELQRQRFYATGNLARFENKNIFICFEKRCSLLHTTL